jgi:hypothetical protein
MLYGLLAGNSQLLTAVLSAVRQHSAAIGRCHSLTEAVLVLSLSAGRLKCTFHRGILLTFKNKGLQR